MPDRPVITDKSGSIGKKVKTTTPDTKHKEKEAKEEEDDTNVSKTNS